MPTSLTITLSDEDLCRLQDLADIAGTSISDYAQSRLLSEMRVDEQVLCLLGDELAVAVRKAYEAMDGYTADRIAASSESPQAQKARMINEVRGALTQGELQALADFLGPSLDSWRSAH